MPAGCNRLGVIGRLWLFHHRTFGVIARVDTARAAHAVRRSLRRRAV